MAPHAVLTLHHTLLRRWMLHHAHLARLAATRGTGPVNAGGGPVEPDDLMTSLLASSRRGAAEAKRERQDNYTKTKTKTKDGGGKGGARAGWGSWG